ncbi:MAG: cohesin domain-containing protein [Patescibacteria group bacterium]|nr:cohesin domain-containing protein [Patescibacteria group bacterium]
MNQKGSITLIIVVIIAVVATGGVYFALKGKQQTAPKDISTNKKGSVTVAGNSAVTPEIPKNVIEKYQELEKIYEQSLGATLSYCTKGSESIYDVSGNGGFSAVSFYFDTNGNQLAEYRRGDVIIPGKELPKPPINILEYECTVLKESKSGDINIPTEEENIPEGTVVIRAGETESVNIGTGDQLTVPVVVDASDIGNLSVASVDITLKWNPSVLRFVSTSQGEFGSLTINDSETGNGVIRAVTFNAEGTTQSFTMFEVKFQAESSGMTNLDVTVNVVGDEFGINITSAASSRDLSVVVN